MGDAVVSYGDKPPAIQVEVRADDAPPQIQAVWISGKTFKGGDLVRIRVTASTNVAVVEMRTFYGGRALIKHDFGKFGSARITSRCCRRSRAFLIRLHFISSRATREAFRSPKTPRSTSAASPRWCG